MTTLGAHNLSFFGDSTLKLGLFGAAGHRLKPRHSPIATLKMIYHIKRWLRSISRQYKSSGVYVLLHVANICLGHGSNFHLRFKDDF